MTIEPLKTVPPCPDHRATPEPRANASVEGIRAKIAHLEAAMKAEPGNLGEDPFPLEHIFTPGLYARQITVPAGMAIVTKLHKVEHLIFMLRGRVSVVTEHGAQEIQAPCMFKNLVGTKRAVYVHEETVWINVFPNPEDTVDLVNLEDRLIARSYEEIGLPEPIEVMELKEGVCHL